MAYGMKEIVAAHIAVNRVERDAKRMTMAEWLDWATENTDTYADDTEL